MRANEFVKKFGWVVAKDLANRDKTSIGYLSVEHCGLNQDDLKRLVESHELIEQYNGLFEAKELIRVSPKLTSELRELVVAIVDVESCK